MNEQMTRTGFGNVRADQGYTRSMGQQQHLGGPAPRSANSDDFPSLSLTSNRSRSTLIVPQHVIAVPGPGPASCDQTYSVSLYLLAPVQHHSLHPSSPLPTSLLTSHSPSMLALPPAASSIGQYGGRVGDEEDVDPHDTSITGLASNPMLIPVSRHTQEILEVLHSL